MSHAKPCLLAPLIAGLGLCCTAYAAAPNMKEGLWETTVRMEMAGMPAGMPPQTVQQCVTAKDLQDPRRTSPGSGPGDKGCETTDYKILGNTASWKISCKGQHSMSGSGSITYNGTTYSGISKLAVNQGGQAQHMTMHYSGKHIGDCKK